MLQVIKILRATRGGFVPLQIRKAKHVHADTIENDSLPFRVTFSEGHAGNRGEDFNPQWRLAHANNLVCLQEKLGPQRRHTKTEIAQHGKFI